MCSNKKKIQILNDTVVVALAFFALEPFFADRLEICTYDDPVHTMVWSGLVFMHVDYSIQYAIHPLFWSQPLFSNSLYSGVSIPNLCLNQVFCTWYVCPSIVSIFYLSSDWRTGFSWLPACLAAGAFCIKEKRKKGKEGRKKESTNTIPFRR